jgi:hypothetical protein
MQKGQKYIQRLIKHNNNSLPQDDLSIESFSPMLWVFDVVARTV